MPQVDLITTIYNREKYLPETLQSVAAQTFQDFQYWLWDDASTDGSGSLASQFAHQHPHALYQRSESKRGHTYGLHSAIALGTAPYIGWVDSDDRLAPTALEKCVAYLDAHPEMGMVYTRFQDIDPAGRVIGQGQRSLMPYSAEGMLLNFMTFHFRLLRRSAYNQVGGVNLSYRYAQDYDLCLKLSETTLIGHIPEVLYDYRHHPDSIGKQHVSRVDQIQAAQRAVEAALSRRGLDRQYYLEVEIYSRFQLKSLPTLSNSTQSANMSG